MKYENPTCEIVLLDSADCLTASGEKELNFLDAPIATYTPNY